MTAITQEKILLLREHAGHILAKAPDEQTDAERVWLQWAEKRVDELNKELA